MNSVTFENLPELPFAAAESINQLRVNLSLCGKDIKSIMITSCEPNEGKSFVSLSLVRSIAASGARVLLIDCDLRNSTYRRKYNLCPGGARIPGIADVLAGRAGLQDVIYRTNIPHAYILPVTSTLPNPSFLLENGVLDQIISQCREIYDYIIVDEFHHAAAPTYQKLLNYYQPKILLGLTATPERMDGKSILPFFHNRIAAEIRLPEAID